MSRGGAARASALRASPEFDGWALVKPWRSGPSTRVSEANGKTGGVGAFVVGVGILAVMAMILFRGMALGAANFIGGLWVTVMDVVLRLVGAMVGH